MTPTIITAIQDPSLLGGAFKDLTSWRAWFVFLKGLFGLPIVAEESEIFAQHTGRMQPPTAPAREGWVIAGRRAGKSRVASLVAVFLACFRDYSGVLAAGERGTVMVIAADRRQARVVFRYIAGLFDGSPMLSQLVESRTKESINLASGITIEVHTASFRTVRGYTIVGAVLDEVSFWETNADSANPDIEILDALRPGMATVPGSLLLGVSTPHRREGVLWNAHSRCFGQDSPVLVWQGTTRDMNPTVPAHVVDAAYEADPSVAAAEFGGRFRDDLESFVSPELVERAACGSESPSRLGVRYFAFCDPAGGSGSDSMTLAVAHCETRDEIEGIVLDLVREARPPFSPERTVRDFSETLREYGLDTVRGDRFGGAWVAEMCAKQGIRYEPSERTRSEIYLELLPLLNSERVELLDNPRLIAQLVGLERRTSRGGRDSVDHGPRGHDDLINAAAGAIVLAAKEGQREPARLWTARLGALPVLDFDFTGDNAAWRMLV